jgi:hypothetical protein
MNIRIPRDSDALYTTSKTNAASSGKVTLAGAVKREKRKREDKEQYQDPTGGNNKKHKTQDCILATESEMQGKLLDIVA